MGALKTFMAALQAAPSMAGISVAFGEENRYAQEFSLPYVVVVPRGGPFKPGQGYAKGLAQTVPIIWSCTESVDVEIWAMGGTGATVDDAEAVENTAALVLQAFYYQRSQGLTFTPKSRQWQTLQDSTGAHLGRGLTISISIEISIPGATTPTATVTGVTINESITAS